MLHKSSEWSSLVSGPGLNLSPPEAKNPGVLYFSNSLSLPCIAMALSPSVRGSTCRMASSTPPCDCRKFWRTSLAWGNKEQRLIRQQRCSVLLWKLLSLNLQTGFYNFSILCRLPKWLQTLEFCVGLQTPIIRCSQLPYLHILFLLTNTHLLFL